MPIIEAGFFDNQRHILYIIEHSQRKFHLTEKTVRLDDFVAN